MKYSLASCKVIELPTIHDERGDLSVIEAERHIPFGMQRVYYVHRVPAGVHRGGHAHKTLQQFMVAIAGSFDVVLKDGHTERRYRLDRADRGLYICPMIWRELENFSAAAVCMVVASQHYDASDYLYDYAEYVAARRGER